MKIGSVISTANGEQEMLNQLGLTLRGREYLHLCSLIASREYHPYVPSEESFNPLSVSEILATNTSTIAIEEA
jgi:hypothetical protein